MNLKYENLKGKKYAVHCETIELYRDSLMITGNKHGFTDSEYEKFKELTVLDLSDERFWGTIDRFAEKGFTIIPAFDFIAANTAEPEMKEGEYYIVKEHEYIGEGTKRVWLIKINKLTADKIYSDSIFISRSVFYTSSSWGEYHQIESKRLATTEERQWLDACISAGKYLSKEEALKPKELTPDELLEEAKRRYPARTKTNCLSEEGDIRIITGEYKMYSTGDIWAKAEGAGSQCIYKDGIWAEIVSMPEDKKEPNLSPLICSYCMQEIPVQEPEKVDYVGRYLKALTDYRLNCNTKKGQYFKVKGISISKENLYDNEGMGIIISEIGTYWELMPIGWKPSDEQPKEIKAGDWVVFDVEKATKESLNTNVWNKAYVIQVKKVNGISISFTKEELIRAGCSVPLLGSSCSNYARVFRLAQTHEIPTIESEKVESKGDIIGYEVPQDYYKGKVKKGTIIKIDEAYEDNSTYSIHIDEYEFFPAELVETWKPIYAEDQEKIKARIAELEAIEERLMYESVDNKRELNNLKSKLV